METATATYLLKAHHRLRRKYYFELLFLMLFLGLYLLGFIYVFIFHFSTMMAGPLRLTLWILPGLLYLLFLIIFVPNRFKMLQKYLLLTFFDQARQLGLRLIPNPKGNQSFNYAALFKESNIYQGGPFNTLSAYEYSGRLIHVLTFKTNKKNKTIIHIPRMESPYFLQIHNGNFPTTTSYKDAAITKVSFVSPYHLNYYATSGPTNIKVYLRRVLEAKFINIFAYLNTNLNYIATYSEELLLIEDLTFTGVIALNAKYSVDYYQKLLKDLLTLQRIMAFMLEKRM